jgi:MarR family transcriptional regulator, organic hydroperoxide resistance regulator
MPAPETASTALVPPGQPGPATSASLPAGLPSADTLLRLDAQLCFPLYAATNLLQRLYRPLLAPLGLTYSQYLVMLVLWQQDPSSSPLSVGDLGQCLLLDNGTLTPLLKRMEQAGHLQRHRDARDERRVLIALTQEGRALRSAASAIPVALVERMNLGAHDLQGLAQLQVLSRRFVQSLSHSLCMTPPETTDDLPLTPVTDLSSHLPDMEERP